MAIKVSGVLNTGRSFGMQLLKLPLNVFFLIIVFGWTAKSVFANILPFLTLEACDQDRTLFYGHTKTILCNKCSLSCC